DTQELIRSGYRWRIGDGKRVRIWSNPWLRDDGQLTPNTNLVARLEDLTVCDLWIQGTKEWDVGLVEELFEPWDVEVILRIPTVHMEEEDIIIWHYGQFGVYIVKTAYKLYMESAAGREVLRSQGNWNAIWKLQLPPKVKHFLWRVARGVLPLRRNLWHR
ncbi:Putative ribonuclease H protein At1g65750, partial [Linum perenne]